MKEELAQKNSQQFLSRFNKTSQLEKVKFPISLVEMAEAHKRVYRHPKYKTSYRIKNWSEYEQSLRNRGDITVWLS